jgi:hypothetical protein
VVRLLYVNGVCGSIACFVLPLRGMQRRIAAEKSRLLAAANDRFMTRKPSTTPTS